MTKIRLYRHPFSGEPPEVHVADSLAEWLLAHYGERLSVNLQVYAGEPSVESFVPLTPEALISANEGEYSVLQAPGGPLIPMIIMMVISAAIRYLSQPSQQINNRSQQSPNNSLSDRSNKVRVMERVEDIYGTVRAVPSLIMPTYAKYINDQKVEFGYYCVGRGYYDISDLRDGDTLISEINGAGAKVYAPFTSPNSGSPQSTFGDVSGLIDPILTVTRSGAVDGIILKALNQLQLTSGIPYWFYGAGPGDGYIPASSADTIWQSPSSRQPNFAAVASAGQLLHITMPDQSVTRTVGGSLTCSASATSNTYTCSDAGFFLGIKVGSTATISGFSNAANNGAHVVTAVSGNTLTVAEALTTEGVASGQTFAVTINYSGARTIASVQNGYVTLTGASQFSTQDYPLGGTFGTGTGGAGTVLTSIVVDNGLSDWTSWTTLPDTSRTEVWTNVEAQAGMYKNQGGEFTVTVNYDVQIEKLDPVTLAPTGIVEDVPGTISGSTTNAKAQTLEHVTGWVGPARVRARRTTPYDYSFNGFISDEIKWVDLNSVAPIDPVAHPHFGNKTTIQTVTHANTDATAIRKRELNCLAARKLPTYNGTSFSGSFGPTGQLASGTISATSRIVDIIAAVTIDPQIGARSITDLDLAQVYGVQQALDSWNTECGQFNYTFDTDQTSFEETLTTIANAAFCIAYRQNGYIRLALDRPQASSVALFTHRNKKPDSETITRKFSADSDYDGIELLYQDPERNSQETIRLPLDGSWTKLKKVEVPGIRSFTQAWFRANREYQRLKVHRLSIETECTADARILLPNARVDIVDNTKFQSWDGEVVGQSGLTLTLSRDVQFTVGATHSVVLMKRDGTLQSVACTAGSAANQIVLASAPAEAIVTTPTPSGGQRTIFSFAADSARGAMAWLIQELSSTDGQYVKLTAINYSDTYYTADSQAVPPKSSVID